MLKKIVSLILSLLIIFSCSLVTFAENKIPVQDSFYLKYDEEIEVLNILKSYFPEILVKSTPTFDEYVSALKNLKVPDLSSLETKSTLSVIDDDFLEHTLYILEDNSMILVSSSIFDGTINVKNPSDNTYKVKWTWISPVTGSWVVGCSVTITLHRTYAATYYFFTPSVSDVVLNMVQFLSISRPILTNVIFRGNLLEYNNIIGDFTVMYGLKISCNVDPNTGNVSASFEYMP